MNKNNEVLVTCNYCKVCSIGVSSDEYKAILSGQQMLLVCPVCNKEILVDQDTRFSLAN